MNRLSSQIPAGLPLTHWFPCPNATVDEALDLVTARPAHSGDQDFLYALYAATRAAELVVMGWPEEMRQAFLDQQFNAQHRHYRECYADALWLLLLRNGQPIGRLYWWADGNSTTLIDISLMPDVRGQGIGSAVLALLCDAADGHGQSISLHVEPSNPALHMYLHAGFKLQADLGIHMKMLRPPGQHASL
jgi:GNAT superfamily N-acetyltransferase